ncbi:hypothetical protein C7M84_019918 [Penaeus vannamei]|uniref:Uncharacterized protein n=1 Tax=Penaeus vannamei TaxID=6689 RepID=A0A3R7P653_PENVA|nr:hypothetical protein C7M84_019918 [Penaeus vannamei]
MYARPESSDLIEGRPQGRSYDALHGQETVVSRYATVMTALRLRYPRVTHFAEHEELSKVDARSHAHGGPQPFPSPLCPCTRSPQTGRFPPQCPLPPWSPSLLSLPSQSTLSPFPPLCPLPASSPCLARPPRLETLPPFLLWAPSLLCPPFTPSPPLSSSDTSLRSPFPPLHPHPFALLSPFLASAPLPVPRRLPLPSCWRHRLPPKPTDDPSLLSWDRATSATLATPLASSTVGTPFRPDPLPPSTLHESAQPSTCTTPYAPHPRPDPPSTTPLTPTSPAETPRRLPRHLNSHSPPPPVPSAPTPRPHLAASSRPLPPTPPLPYSLPPAPYPLNSRLPECTPPSSPINSESLIPRPSPEITPPLPSPPPPHPDSRHPSPLLLPSTPTSSQPSLLHLTPRPIPPPHSHSRPPLLPPHTRHGTTTRASPRCTSLDPSKRQQ